MKTRVAIVLPYFGSGGAENMVSRLAASLDTDRIDAQVICLFGQPQNNSLEKAVLDNGIEIKYIGKGLGFSADAVFKLGKCLSEFKPDVVHSHLSAGVYCAAWLLTHKVKLLHTVHNMPAYELIKPKRAVMSLLYKLGKAVPVAISDEIHHLMQTEYKLKTDAELIYNPVDVDKFASVEKKSHSGFTVITAGRLSQQKNQTLLLDAFKILKEAKPDAKLVILGEGTLRQNLEEHIAQLGLSDCVELKGNVSDVENWFAQADVFALSSLYEGLPLAVLEAMAAGLPIVSTDVGGVKDIVTDNGLLVKFGRADLLANALLQLANDSELKEKMSLASSVNVQKYDSKEIAQQYMRLYEKFTKRVEDSNE